MGENPVVRGAFPRARRIQRRADFLRIQAAPGRVSTPHFVLLVARQPDGPRPPRLGIVVTRKVGNAVFRNRIKRLCRECFRRWEGLLPDGVDLVVIARQGAQTLLFDGVAAEWARALSQLRRTALQALAPGAPRTHASGTQGPAERGPPKPRPRARGRATRATKA